MSEIESREYCGWTSGVRGTDTFVACGFMRVAHPVVGLMAHDWIESRDDAPVCKTCGAPIAFDRPDEWHHALPLGIVGDADHGAEPVGVSPEIVEGAPTMHRTRYGRAYGLPAPETVEGAVTADRPLDEERA